MMVVDVETSPAFSAGRPRKLFDRMYERSIALWPNYDAAPDYSQPNSALIQCNPGELVLLRLANLGYTQDAMHLAGISMKVVGQDASLLRVFDHSKSNAVLDAAAGVGAFVLGDDLGVAFRDDAV